MTTLTARTLITGIGTVEYAVITVDEAGRIADISSDPSLRSDTILAPAFFDVHIHGAAGHDVMDATPAGLSAIQRFLASRGTAQYLPTTVTAEIARTEDSLAALAAHIEAPTAPGEATPLGIHLEGPFLSHAKRGVHPAALLQPPSIELFERFQHAARGHIRLVTVAPELLAVPGNTLSALDFIRHVTAQGVRVSLGHSNATEAEALAAIDAGAASATHTFNAMRALDHREPGLAATVLDTSALYAELICDGIHVAPALVRLWLRAKQDHALLVTDGMSATGMPDGAYTLGGLDVTVSREGGFNGTARCSLTDAPGTLAGSVLTLDRAVENLCAFTGCPLAQSVRCASTQPAAMLGLQDTVASVRAGQPAHLNQYTPGGYLERTYLHGRAVV